MGENKIPGGYEILDVYQDEPDEWFNKMVFTLEDHLFRRALQARVSHGTRTRETNLNPDNLSGSVLNLNLVNSLLIHIKGHQT